MGLKLTDEFIRQTILRAKAELEAEDSIKQNEEESTMGESELQRAEEAQEVTGAIRGGTGDLDGYEEEPRKKRKYTRHAPKEQQKGDRAGSRVPDGIQKILRQELDKCEEEITKHRHAIAELDARVHEIMDFLGEEKTEAGS